MSILEENNLDKNVVFTDMPLLGNLNSQGAFKTQTNENALSQALKIWLVSGKGEKIRSGGGGYLLPYLAKPLNKDYANKIRESILSGLEADFKPALTVVDLQVIPDEINRKWLIYLKGYNEETGIGVNTLTQVKSLGA